ncbi:putative activator of 90kDa heat shock protein ATPase [Helianthus annuus]|nr:putative activator of 90kDa heat shock protein ATPase [Helianthus annuus]
MEGGVVSTEKQSTYSTTASSYTYWVREVKQDVAPLPIPRKLTAEYISAGSYSCTHLGSAWNKANGVGTKGGKGLMHFQMVQL